LGVEPLEQAVISRETAEPAVAGMPRIVKRAELLSESQELTPIQRLSLLCDPGSFNAMRQEVRSIALGERAQPGDGVVAGAGKIEGRPIFCYSQDARFLGGSLGEAQAETIARVLSLAGRRRTPVVSFIESGGARMQEGLAALAGYGQIFSHNIALSGRVPQISVISGVSAGGASYSPALTDFVLMTRQASMFLTGPAVVRQVLGEDVSSEELGGHAVHSRNGVCHLVADDDTHSISLVRQLLSYLPQNAWERPPVWPARGPLGHDPGQVVPSNSRHVYDVRDVIRRLVDAGEMLELSPLWAPNIVIALARIDGMAVGIVANQPKRLAGVLDESASQKAARFVRTCNSFGLPLVVLVDTPGFMPGTERERAGVIRHGAKLLYAFGEATVPKITVILRKAYGGAYISMNSKSLGAHWTFAWEDAEIGIMGASQAVGVIHRRELASATDPERAAARLSSAYAAEHLSAQGAAQAGHVDEVIAPASTRMRICATVAALGMGAQESGEHGNIPL
jgi:acetyl-CoA carboxylase carboxyltransferase component